MGEGHVFGAFAGVSGLLIVPPVHTSSEGTMNNGVEYLVAYANGLSIPLTTPPRRS